MVFYFVMPLVSHTESRIYRAAKTPFTHSWMHFLVDPLRVLGFYRNQLTTVSRYNRHGCIPVDLSQVFVSEHLVSGRTAAFLIKLDV